MTMKKFSNIFFIFIIFELLSTITLMLITFLELIIVGAFGIFSDILIYVTTALMISCFIYSCMLDYDKKKELRLKELNDDIEKYNL